ncbi:DUF1800 domain-containing protein [Hymenobacter sp. BT664]|uniref:DUF1800 domain-containing protein n=1 Tax=Hymenobacter montanus TaxID=2771359 RepID=A0A927BEY2_9BACT|nr:DUF1800 domain-containing protein [Hymenobacter montanus]MBD2769626.1 DUF1800 domain-containing protein [Hymenobacter montanus]
MNRRTFLRKPAAPVATLFERPAASGDQPPGKGETVSKFANKDLPATPRSLAGLAPYTGPWGPVQAAHLLRRATFGPTRAEINTAASQSLTQVLDRLFTVPATPDPPVQGFPGDPLLPVGAPFVTGDYEGGWSARSSVRAWWLGLMLKDTTIVEKMTLFWHNHFVITFDLDGGTFDSRFAYRYCALLREQALGNFKQLAKDMTVEPGMLKYLNGSANTVDAPNENYGRELLELFTIGKGRTIGPGNYTTYTEADVQAAARVLTGWQHSEENINGFFTDSLHEPGVKRFSSAFGNRTIANQGDQEYKALIDLIFDRTETAAFIVRKLYRWFVYYVIDATTEANVIQPLAAQLRQNGYNVGPVVRTLLASEHFFDAINIGCMIKSPIDFVVGAVRQMSVTFPPESNTVELYTAWSMLVDGAEKMQQFIGNAPNVAGWPAYWQTPQYYEMWINAMTLPLRNQFTDRIINEYGYDTNFPATVKLRIETIDWVQSLPPATAADCNLLIAEFVRHLLPFPLTANQMTFLNDTLLPGLPDFEWTVEWQAFLADPDNMTKRSAVDSKLRAVVRQIMGLAEFHLS